MDRWSVRAVLLAVALGVGCENTLDTQVAGNLAVRITVEIAEAGQDGPVTITAVLRNLTDRDLSLRMQCSVLGVESEGAAGWVRYEDLRLCAPPDRMTLGARATITIVDGRFLSPGRYRVFVETIDGRSAFSEAFSVGSSR